MLRTHGKHMDNNTRDKVDRFLGVGRITEQKINTIAAEPGSLLTGHAANKVDRFLGVGRITE